MKITAYAKINLTLDIPGVRPDGYHAISSVMAPVSLWDEITIEKSNTLFFDCNKKELWTADNLWVRAAKLFFATVNISPSVAIYLQKNIPYPAGLGGGSADAAAVLLGLNEIYGFPLDKKILFALSEQLGSDVPFCLLAKPALCEGRGEILTPLEGVPELDIVIAIGESRLPTPAVFRSYDNANLPPRCDTARFLSCLTNNDKSNLVSSLGNAFEPVTDILAPETALLREKLSSLGALNSRLSGSGPSVYGVFENAEKAHLAAKALKNQGYFAVSCKIIN